ncbi:MAG: WecB/TagA/CpsF family glycosyltransferase [Alphaproteobacteria bacterium]|nr:WecB/TagA/CpsF family glycosyltransferase [Alphaproteobacteria bacterium]
MERVNVLGTPVSAIDMGLAVDTIDDWIGQGLSHYVCVRDVHGVILARDDAQFRRIHERAGLVTPDGMPIVWFCRLAGYRQVRKVSGTKLFLAVCERSRTRRTRHFFYGATETTLEKLSDALRNRFPGIEIAGVHAPPFHRLDAAEDAETVALINNARADIVWVGLGSPKQEQWMADHVGQLDASVLIGIGAAFDFVAGNIRRAPMWMRKCGLEWLYRLAGDPKRLWRRYLTKTPLFIPLAFLQLTGLRRYPTD